eukprot:155396-Chlamydomonas_euryale.AAC.3
MPEQPWAHGCMGGMPAHALVGMCACTWACGCVGRMSAHALADMCACAWACGCSGPPMHSRIASST